MTNTTEQTRRLSVRKISIQYGIPTGAVIRAIESGDLAAVKINTPSGQDRYYIEVDDASRWIESLSTIRPSGVAQ